MPLQALRRVGLHRGIGPANRSMALPGTIPRLLDAAGGSTRRHSDGGLARVSQCCAGDPRSSGDALDLSTLLPSRLLGRCDRSD